MLKRSVARLFAVFAVVGALAGCTKSAQAPLTVNVTAPAASDYIIGAGDSMQIFVWRNAELSTTVQVRPDGKISVPLIEDLPVSGRTPTQAARDIEKKLSTYIKDPIVTVIMTNFVGPVEDQVRVVGEAAKPLALAYRQGMTVLDVMIAAGGLTSYANGNDASILRTVDGKPVKLGVRLDDLMNNGDLTANVQMAPGDVLTIPQRWF